MSEFVEVKTADLVGAALDWAVAKTEGLPLCEEACQGDYILIGTGFGDLEPFKPSTDWIRVGRLIEKYKVMITYHNAPDQTPLATTSDSHPAFQCGETILIAACRAIVASVLGETVSVPKELLS